MLHTLHLNDNNLTHIAPLNGCPLLHTIDLSFNELSSLPEVVEALSPCSQLKRISLNDNPLSEEKEYRVTILALSAHLEELDSTPVPPGEVWSHRYISDVTCISCYKYSPELQVLAAADASIRRDALQVASFFTTWLTHPWRHLAIAERPAAQARSPNLTYYCYSSGEHR